MQNNDIENNNSEQNAYIFNSVVSQNILIKGLKFQQNINLALMNYQTGLKYDLNLLENTINAKYTRIDMLQSQINSNQYNDTSSYLINYNATQVLLLDLTIFNETSRSKSSLVSIKSQNLTLKNVTFNKNQSWYKSLISLDQSQAFINGSEFIKNILLSQDLGGGVFYLFSSNISIKNTTFDSNEAQ
ncbi:hypothetical protein ABPG74_003828, partial [Tetrahymena malaccensis]